MSRELRSFSKMLPKRVCRGPAQLARSIVVVGVPLGGKNRRDLDLITYRRADSGG